MVRSLVTKTIAHYSPSKRCLLCTGIDLRLSYPFVRSELMHSHKCIRVFSVTDSLIGFVLIKDHAIHPKYLYVPLLVSFEPGIGRLLINELRTNTSFDQEFIALRSTDKALGFYLRLGFVLIDWNTVSDVGITLVYDAELTKQLKIAVSVKNSGLITKIHQILITRDWCEYDAEEWPLAIPRVCEKKEEITGCRRSPRLRKQTIQTNDTIKPLMG